MTQITYYGHAALGLETGGYRILIDPFFQGNPTSTADPDTIGADYIWVSHGHGDHLGDTLPIALRTGAMVIGTYEIVNWLEQQGLRKVHAQHIGGGYRHPFGYLKLTQALHGSSLPDGSYGGNPCGFLLTTLDGERLYLAGDTGLFGDMRLIGDEGLDLAFLPIGDNYTMGPEDAIRALGLLRPKTAIPIHYNTWDLIAQDPLAWADKARKETGTRILVLRPGETHRL